MTVTKLDYYAGEEKVPTIAKEVLLNKGIEPLIKPWTRLIHAYPSRGGFAISIHSVKKRKLRRYLGCKVCGCKFRFSKVRDWNLHHRRVHTGIHLECDTCKKTFKMPSFLRDHQYAHQDTHHVCEKCNNCFIFKSKYRIHRRMYLHSRIHKCCAGSYGKEYKWPQDLHRHIQVHLNHQYGCTVCNYTNLQRYLLKWYLQKHSHTTYYKCDDCIFECKYYTQLSRHIKKCPRLYVKIYDFMGQ